MARINLTDTFRRPGTTLDGRDYIVIGGSVGYLRINREGTGSYYNGLLTDVSMENLAAVQVGPNLTFPPPMQMTAGQLRDLAGLLNDAAGWLDEGVRVPEHPVLLTIHPETGDIYFMGDLDAGKWAVSRDRFVKVTQPSLSSPRYHVSLCDDEACEDTAEWGSGKTEEEAWRYAIGAAFGPIDSEYDERALLNLLTQYEPPVVDEPKPKRKYHPTHVSVRDGSTAMSLGYDEDDKALLLVNEDGFEWADLTSQWLPFEKD